MKSKYLTLIALIFSSFIYAQFEVGSTTITFTDPDRSNREIETKIYYPANTTGTDATIAQGDFPVIAFGHGFVMSWDAYQNIWEELVPRGYIMIFPTTESGFSNSHSNFGADLAFCVNVMQKENVNSSSIFFNHVTDKAAIMGHSMGGGATFLAAANNTNIETIVGLAPAETNPSAAQAAANVGVPALVFHGSSDGVTPANAHASLIYNGLDAVCRNFISITGGAHCYYANSSFTCDLGEATSSNGISITREEQQQTMYDYINKWFDYKLKENCTALIELDDLLSRDTRVTFQDDCIDAAPSNDVTQAADTITATEIVANYQWVDCDNANIPINGETARAFTATTNGNYAVQITKGSCTVLSECIEITNLSTPTFEETIISIFPNPTNGKFKIKINEPAALTIYDLMGKLVYNKTLLTGINLIQTQMSSGAYILAIEAESGKYINRKFIIE